MVNTRTTVSNQDSSMESLQQTDLMAEMQRMRNGTSSGNHGNNGRNGSGNHGNNGRNGGQLVTQYGRLSKLEFPRFNGNDVKGWIFRCRQFFCLDNVDDELKVGIAAMHVYDKALVWHHQFIKRFGENTSWEVYEKQALQRFGSCFEDPMMDLMNLKQTRSVQKYQDLFEDLGYGVSKTKELVANGGNNQESSLTMSTTIGSKLGNPLVNTHTYGLTSGEIRERNSGIDNGITDAYKVFDKTPPEKLPKQEGSISGKETDCVEENVNGKVTDRVELVVLDELCEKNVEDLGMKSKKLIELDDKNNGTVSLDSFEDVDRGGYDIQLTTDVGDKEKFEEDSVKDSGNEGVAMECNDGMSKKYETSKLDEMLIADMEKTFSKDIKVNSENVVVLDSTTRKKMSEIQCKVVKGKCSSLVENKDEYGIDQNMSKEDNDLILSDLVLRTYCDQKCFEGWVDVYKSFGVATYASDVTVTCDDQLYKQVEGTKQVKMKMSDREVVEKNEDKGTKEATFNCLIFDTWKGVKKKMKHNTTKMVCSWWVNKRKGNKARPWWRDKQRKNMGKMSLSWYLMQREVVKKEIDMWKWPRRKKGVVGCFMVTQKFVYLVQCFDQDGLYTSRLSRVTGNGLKTKAVKTSVDFDYFEVFLVATGRLLEEWHGYYRVVTGMVLLVDQSLLISGVNDGSARVLTHLMVFVLKCGLFVSFHSWKNRSTKVASKYCLVYVHQHVHLVTCWNIHQLIHLMTFMEDILYVSWFEGTSEQDMW